MFFKDLTFFNGDFKTEQFCIKEKDIILLGTNFVGYCRTKNINFYTSVCSQLCLKFVRACVCVCSYYNYSF